MIKFNEDNIRLTPSSTSGVVRFRGTTIDWDTISYFSNKEWCTVVMTKETATDGILTISVESNEGDDRTALITMVATDLIDGEQTYIITVNQEGNVGEPYFTISTSAITLTSAEQYFYTGYDAFRVNDIVADITADWIAETEPFRYFADYNGSNERTSTITYTAYFDNGTTQNRTLTVNQAGAIKEVILSTDSVEVDYNSQDVEITASITGIDSYTLVSDLPDWLGANVSFNDDFTAAIFQITTEYNTSNFDRDFNIVWDFEGVEVTIKVIQKGNIEYLEFPIWEDTEIDFGGDTYFRVVDESNNKVIYSGRAYGGSIYINRIIKSHVENTIDLFNIPFGGRFMSNDAYKTFKIQIQLNGEFSNYSIVRTYYDYSYEINTNHQLSKPISNIIDDRQLFVFTGFNSYKDEAQTLMFQNYTPDPHTSGGITRYFELEKGIYTYIYNKLVPDGVIVDYSGNEQHFLVKRTCAKYACYYLNKYGGWDSMLFMGRSTKDNVNNTISQVKKDINNSTKDFQYADYQRVRKVGHKLNTNYLSDKQSSMMHLLLDSNKVYLHNLETNDIFPVTIKTNAYDVKTYFNQNRKLFTYSIEFINSKEEVIR